MYRTFESIKNWQRYKCLKIFVIPGGNTPPTKFSRGDTSATLPNLNGRYQGTTCTYWLNFYTPCKSQPISFPYYRRLTRLAAYYTVNNRIITRTFFEITQDARLTELIQNMFSNRRFFCGPRRQTQQMAQTEEWPSTRQRPCPSVVQHNTNDQAVHPKTRSFLYADDLCIAT